MKDSREYVIYNYLDPEFALDHTASPSHIIYPQQIDADIFTNHVRVDGERIRTTYYGSLVNGEYADPILKEDYEYIRDEKGFLEKRKLSITWMMKDGTWSSFVKVKNKYFNDATKKLEEKVLRRKNLVAEITGRAKDFGLGLAIKQLFEKYFVEIGQYENSGSKAFSQAIENDTELPWLDMYTEEPPDTVRQWLVRKFLIATEQLE